MSNLKKRSFNENKLKLVGDLGHTDISQKWQILKSLTEGGEIKDDPAQEISLIDGNNISKNYITTIR